MNRLIDADAYTAEMRERQDECKAWKDGLAEGTELYARAEQSLVTFAEAALTLKSQPTIDAIPVEWMRKYQVGLDGPWYITMSVIDNIICRWERESGKGIDNSEKTGIWEPLGHRIGFCKHPLSEDFRCSLCGYEAYTVFDPPPERCPVCDAKMSLEQEAQDDRG